MYIRQPNILRWLTFGFSPEKASLGVLLLNTLYGSVHTQLSLLLLPISASKYLGHVALILLLLLLLCSFVLQHHSVEDCKEC